MWRLVVLAACLGCTGANVKTVREGLYVINAKGTPFGGLRATQEEASRRAAEQCPRGYLIRDRFEPKGADPHVVLTIECNTSGKVTVAPGKERAPSGQ